MDYRNNSNNIIGEKNYLFERKQKERTIEINFRCEPHVMCL